MLSALGHCEDLECKQSNSSIENFVRLFRCTIHCDRLLCLHHLNAHNQYYEEEKKQNQFVLNELQNHLTIYQNLFDQHLQEYRELVQQASNLLLQNTSTTIPIEQIRSVLERIQRAMDLFRPEKSLNAKFCCSNFEKRFFVCFQLLLKMKQLSTEVDLILRKSIRLVQSIIV